MGFFNKRIQTKMSEYIIKPGIGLNKICFGATMDDCRDYFGQPEEELKEEFEGEEYISWYYDDGKMALCFEGSEDFRLGTVIVNNKNATLNNEKIIGKSLDEINKYLKKNNYVGVEEVLEEDIEEDPSSAIKIINVDDLECNFMFTNDILDGVQWSYLWEDDETPRWPTIQ